MDKTKLANILTADELAKRKFENGLTRESKVFAGTADENLHAAEPKVIASEAYKVGSKTWENSEGRFELYREIKKAQDEVKNSANAPSSTAMALIMSKLFIDVQRLSDDMADYSPEIYNVIQRDDFQELSYLRDLTPYTGKEGTVMGANDPVPLMDQKTASTETITQVIKAFGWKDSLKNVLFNSLHNMQRVAKAAAEITVDGKNNDVIGNIVGTNFHANYSQAADATVGATYDELLYNTYRKAYKKLGTFTHPLTGRPIAETGAYLSQCKLLNNPQDVWSTQRVISGMLASSAKSNVIGSPLPIQTIIPYGGGIQNGLTWGEETLSLPGVPAGTAYMFVKLPLGGFVGVKRDTTMEVGSGDVLQLSTEARAWYRVRGLNHAWFIGGAVAGTGGCAIIEITLPSET